MILDSAPKRFATVDLFVTPTVAAMHKYGRECTKSSADEYFTVQGDDLVVPIPFEHEVDTMFLDTLHASWLLEQELVRYPSHVKHYMAFHDTFSFMNIDEVYPTVTERRNEKTQTWRGLKVVFDDFLRTHKDEWVEDMSYIHNNGLYVLRRKSFVPTLPQITSSSGQYDFENSVQSDLGANLMSEEQCRQLIGAIGSPDSKICDQVYVFYRRTALTDSYTRLSMGSHPLARQLPVIFGYTIAVNSFRVMDCVTPVLIAALHGAKSNDRTMYVASSLTPENCPALQYLRERVPQEYQSIQFSDSVKVDLVISKAGTSESFEGRVYTLEYGTSVLASHLTANDAFELHSVLQQKPGIAVWKKKGAMDYNYIQL
jgi:metal-sulfur cluster biosynthetic enzyme